MPERVENGMHQSRNMEKYSALLIKKWFIVYRAIIDFFSRENVKMKKVRKKKKDKGKRGY
jgi:hypothetical protein